MPVSIVSLVTVHYFFSVAPVFCSFVTYEQTVERDHDQTHKQTGFIFNTPRANRGPSSRERLAPCTYRLSHGAWKQSTYPDLCRYFYSHTLRHWCKWALLFYFILFYFLNAINDLSPDTFFPFANATQRVRTRDSEVRWESIFRCSG